MLGSWSNVGPSPEPRTDDIHHPVVFSAGDSFSEADSARLVVVTLWQAHLVQLRLGASPTDTGENLGVQ
jgi:hypothetical protein